MSSTLVESAKSWLYDADYIKVYKPWWEVFEDFAARGLFIVGVLGLVVRYLGSIDSGVLQCVLISLVDTSDVTVNSTVMIPGPSINLALSAYASNNLVCTRKLVSFFAMHGPIILFGQAMILIYLEKFIFYFPRISSRMEKFYKIVLVKAMEGEDPDLIEDFSPMQAGVLKTVISRRQKEEICASLKKSSLLFYVYIIQNVLQTLLALVFVACNAFYANHLYGRGSDHGTCELEMDDETSDHLFDTIEIHTRTAILQCQQKRLDFFVMLIIMNCVCLSLFVICALVALFWIALPAMGRGGRVSSIFRRLQHENKDLINFEGRDFLLLFDLLSQTQGLPSSLRILSHCSPIFADICEPELDPEIDLVKTEHSLRIMWRRSKLQKFTQDENVNFVTKYKVSVASSDTNEFPDGILEEEILVKGGNDAMNVTFFELNGENASYSVTVAPVINSSRLKGKRFKTKLLPSPPKNLSLTTTNLNDSTGLMDLCAAWTSPEGFHKLLELRLDTAILLEQEESSKQVITLLKGVTEYVFKSLQQDKSYEVRLFSRNGKEINECPRK